MKRRVGRFAAAGAALLCVAALVVTSSSTNAGSWQGAVLYQLQKLANWKTGVLGGKASLVTECAKGNNAACDTLVKDPGAVAALQTIDAKNPHGFTAKHPHKAAILQRKFEIDAPAHMYKVKRLDRPLRRVRSHPPHRQRPKQAKHLASHRVPEPLSYYKKNRALIQERRDGFDRAFDEIDRLHGKKQRVPEPLSYYGKGFKGAEKNYKTPSATKREWKLHAWKDGALLAKGTSPWLKACAEGNYFACGQLNKNNDEIRSVLQARAKRKPAAKRPALKPVFVSQRKQKSVWGEFMDAVGLGDTYDKNTEVLHSVPMMEPDQGLGRGKDKVFNDGTVGFLSDALH
jgi:hypothetical protein